MDPERWKRIDEIFHSVLNREPSVRATFLNEACEGDVSLRLELERLIACHEKSNLLENPPSDLAAALLAKEETYKDTISHYRILKKIGRGGMGEVYLAEDTRLNRKVALKLLPPEFTKDKNRIRRFEQEARAVSALNHPNILTIHDIGETEASSFIATEYIDGESLRQHMRVSKMALKELLKIVIQVAEALDAAHQAGIIHRDIKPENIMLRSDGYVKVLDFGLAKLIESQPEGSHIETVTSTKTGIVIGTVRYMSPEQARGLKVDARSDIFSLGVVLYELIVGRAPFEGATSSDIIAAILEKNPPALSNFGEFPDELQWIVTKALAKDVEERYQTSKDLLADLKRTKKRLDVEEEVRRSDSSAIVQPVRKAKWAVISLLALIAIAAIYFLYSKVSPKTEAPKIPFSKMKLTRLTSSGLAGKPDISPDGKYVSYVQTEQNQQRLYLKQLAADTEIQILTLPQNTFFWEAPVFSQDGEYLYYETWQPSVSKIGSLYRIPVLGGISQKVLEDLEYFAISPDGKRLAFSRKVKQEMWLMAALPDGKEQRKIRSRKLPDEYGHLAWSPDGKIIASILYQQEPYNVQIVGIQVKDGSERSLSVKWTSKSRFYEDLGWIADGSGLILAIGTKDGEQLCYLSYPSGALTSITSDLNTYSGLSLTRDSKRLVTTKYSNISTAIWVAPSSNPNAAVQITSGFDLEEGANGLSWTPEGKIIYSSREQTGPYQLWRIDPAGTNRKQITAGEQGKYLPVASPDGRYIVYSTDEEGIWRMDSDGGNPMLLPVTKPACAPRFSPDSKWILYSTPCNEEPGKGKERLVKISIDGREKTTLASHEMGYGAAVSPKGDKIAYVYRDDPASKYYLLNIISSAGGVPLKNFKLGKDVFPEGRIHWTPDASGIAYIMSEETVSNIRVQPLDGSPEHRLTNFTSDSINNFCWSLDGKQIAYNRSKKSSQDIVLIENQP